MGNLTGIVGALAIVLLVNLAWIGGGAMIARKFGWTGKWAIYKGQLVIWIPIVIIILVALAMSGELSG